MTVIPVVGGRESSMTGISPTQTIMRVAMLPILSLKSGPWKKVKRVRMVMRISGMKMIRASMMGYLQKGIVKVMTLNERYLLDSSVVLTLDKYFSHSTLRQLSAKSYSPKLPSSVNISCSKILLFSSELLFPTLFMQLNLNFTGQQQLLSILQLLQFNLVFDPSMALTSFKEGSSRLISSKLRDSLKLRRLKGAMKSSDSVPGDREMVNYFLMVHLRISPYDSEERDYNLICPQNTLLAGSLRGSSLLN